MSRMRVMFTSHLGRPTRAFCTSVATARARLAELERLEADTVRCAPTHSGSTRFNQLAEAEAIRAALTEVRQ